MLVVPGLLRIDSVILTTTTYFLAIASLASAASSDGALHRLRNGGAGVDSGGSHGLGSVVVDEQQTAPRRILADLLHDCAANNIPDQDTVDAFDNTTALSLGAGIARILTGKKRAGGEEGTWYEDKLASLLVEFCEEEQRDVHNRYVTSQNTTAAKDEYGVCVQVLDGDQDAYAAGLCERVANCYWEEPREFVERARRYTDAQYETNEHAARYYVQSIIVTYGTLGFVLAAAVFVGCAKFAVRRGIYNKCVCDSDLQRDRTGYTDAEQKTPVAIFVAGLITVAVAGLLGLQGNRNVTLGLELIFTTVEEATDGIQELASSVSLPLGSFKDSLNASTEEVQLLLSRTSEWLGELERGTLLRLEAFDSAHRDHFLGRGPEFDTLAAAVGLATANFVLEAVDDVSAVMDVLQQDFLDMTDIMEGQSLNVLAALAAAKETALENGDRFAFFRAWSDAYVGVRTTGIQGLVAAVCAAGVVGLLGVTAGLAKNKACLPCVSLLRLTCVVTLASTWAAFIVSSLFIVSAVAWSDGCHFLLLAATNGWETVGFDGLSAGVFDGCLRGNPVTEELNLTDALGFFESFPDTAEEVGALDATAAEADVEAAVYAILDFVDSLNATVVAVSHLDFYTNAEVNGSLLLDPDCPYNVTFEGEEATAYLGRPWLALPTVSAAAAAVVAENANSSSNSSSSSGTSNSTANSTDWTDHTTISPLLTPWQAGGSRQSFGRQGDESAAAYMSRVFNSSNCSSVNGDLLVAWDLAARERAYRDQMRDDLTCTETESTATSSNGGCAAGGNASSSSLASSSSSPFSSSSSTFSLSSCSCTSDDYNIGAPDTVLAHFRTFADNVTGLRADLAGLLTLPLAAAEGRGALANASSESWEARCASRCSFIASLNQNFEGAMCGTALSGLAQVGFSMFLIGVGALALAITSGIMVHRLKAAWAKNMAKVLSTEEDIVMEEY